MSDVSTIRFQCPVCLREGPVGGRCSEHGTFFCDPQSIARAHEASHLGELIDGRYAVLGLLGRGGMATVYWCFEVATNRRLAIKIMRRDLSDTLNSAKRFLREAEAIKKLSNPRVVRCDDYGVADDMAYMTMEFLEGTTLNTFVAHRQPDFPEIAAIATQMLEGLAAIHGGGIVHRDIKPGNIMICEVAETQASVKIIDFGLARGVDDEEEGSITMMGDVLGTARYMSPEHINGSHSVGRSSDVYALGVMLYELLAGATPFNGATPLDTLKLHLSEPVPPLVCRPGLHCPSELEAFIGRCLDKDPKTRFRDGGQALAAYWMLDLPDEGTIDLTVGWKDDEGVMPVGDLMTIELGAEDLLSDASIEITLDDEP